MIEAVFRRDGKDGMDAEHARSMIAAIAAATTTPESTGWSRFPTTSSMVKVTAAMGALKAAAIPAAVPTGKRRLRVWVRSRQSGRPCSLSRRRSALSGPRGPGRSRCRLERRDEELADGIADPQRSALPGIGDLHLGNAAAARVGNDALKQGPRGEAAPGSGRGASTKSRSSPARTAPDRWRGGDQADEQVKCHRGEVADPADHDGERGQLAGVPSARIEGSSSARAD